MKPIIFNINRVLILRFAALVFAMLAFFGSVFAETLCPADSYAFNAAFMSKYKNITVTYACNNQNPLYSTQLWINDQMIGLNKPSGCSSFGSAFVPDGATIRIYGMRDIGGGNYLQGAGNWGNSYYPPSWVPACTLAWDDGGGGIPEGFLTLNGTLKTPALSLGKTASSSTFTRLASGQSYTLTITVTSGPTTGSISISDSLPAGITTSGAVAIDSTNSGKLSGCPAAGATNLTGCTVATGAVTPIVITVPVNVSLSTAASVTNTASISGGGDAACTGSGVCQSNITTSVVAPPSPTMVINKSLGSSRVNSADQFTVQILNAGNVVNNTANSTTTGAGSTVVSGTSGTFTAVAGTAYTLNEAGSGGANLGQYQSTITCTDSAGIQTGLPSSAAFSASTGHTLTPVAGAKISCTITNTAKSASLSLSKAVGGNGRAKAGDQFVLALKTGGVNGTAVASTTTTGTGTTATGSAGLAPTTAGTAYTLTEAASAGANLGQYSSTLTCTDSAGIQTGLPSAVAYSASTGLTLTPVAGAQISCTITNTPKLPSITLDQIVSGGIALPASYSYSGTNGWSTQNVGSTVAGVAGTATPVQSLTAFATDTTITPALPAGLKINNAYCTDSNYLNDGNSGGTFGSFTDGSFSIAAANLPAGAVLVCHTVIGFSNPSIALSKRLSGNRINNNDQFTVQIRDAAGSTSLATGTTTGSGATVSGGSTGIYTATAATKYTINEAMAAGSASSLAQYGASVACSNSGLGGTVVTGVTKLGDGFTVAPGDVISCVVTNTPQALLTLSKALGGTGRIASADQFRVVLIDQFGSYVASAVTTGSGTSVGGGVTSAAGTPGTKYMVGEEMVAGSSSNIEQYDYPVTCSNSLSVANGGTDVSAVGLGKLFGPLVAGDAISCTINNTPKPAQIFVTQLISAGAHQFPVIASYTGTNGWTQQTLSSTTSGLPGVSTPRTALTAFNAMTQITANPPLHWSVLLFACTDLNSAITGNTGTFGVLSGTAVTIAAANVRAGSVLQCRAGLDAKPPY